MTQGTDRPVDAALRYAGEGWQVFPCHTPLPGGCSCRHADCSSPGKHPRIGGGLKSASTDQDTIRRWWGRWPNANVAIRTGEVSGLVVIDIDPQHDGCETLDRLVREHRQLPTGPAVRTGSGGQHLFFAHPGETVRNSAGTRLGPGIDIRGDGGYVIAPPSRHRSGDSYQWERHTLELPALPAWVLSLTRDPPPSPRSGSREPIRIDQAISAWARAALDGEAQRVQNAVEGTRNHSLNRAAFCLGQIVAAGILDETLVEGVLIDSALAAGLGEREARATVRSGMAAGLTRPRAPSTASRVISVPSAAALSAEAEIELAIPDLPLP